MVDEAQELGFYDAQTRSYDAAAEQPFPVKSDGVCVQDQLAADLRERAQALHVVGSVDLKAHRTMSAAFEHAAEDILRRKDVGVQRYGTVLHPFNGRNALLDAYQELLDGAVYLRQVIEEKIAAPGNVHRAYPGELHRAYEEVIVALAHTRILLDTL